MVKPDHDPSIHHEPHLKGTPARPDPSESASERALDRDHQASDPEEERVKYSIFDEPTLLPNRPSVLIERDWSCRNCGYNLRGLMTGHPCPECGKVELYEPPREGEQTYGDWLAAHAQPPAGSRCWLTAFLVPILAIPAAVFCAFIIVEQLMVVMFVLSGPVLAEVLKIALAAILIERRSPLVQSVAQIHVMTLGTAVVFAVVQNLIHQRVLYTSAPVDQLVYRWLVGTALHLICTGIATSGLIIVWKKSREERRAFDFAIAGRWLTAAVVLHATYNLCIFLKGWTGYGF